MSRADRPTPAEKSVSYTTKQPYFTLGQRSHATERTWVVFHGIGYLAPYFLRHFEHLDTDRNYIIAPQAPSRYYLTDTYDRVGACWLTRQHTTMQMENLLHYLDRMVREEEIDNATDLVLFGYSQGVSVLCRWVAHRKIHCNRLVLYAGKVPDELEPHQFDHLPDSCRVELLYGNEDPLAAKWDRSELIRQGRRLFGNRLRPVVYDGGHELLREWIRE